MIICQLQNNLTRIDHHSIFSQDFTAGTLAGAAQLVVGHPFGEAWPLIIIPMLNVHSKLMLIVAPLH